MRVFSLVHLVEGGKSYRPGDEITEGQLFIQAEYYAKIKKVRIDDGATNTAIATQQATWQDADQEQTFKNALDKVAAVQDDLTASKGRGRPKKQ